MMPVSTGRRLAALYVIETITWRYHRAMLKAGYSMEPMFESQIQRAA